MKEQEPIRQRHSELKRKEAAPPPGDEPGVEMDRTSADPSPPEQDLFDSLGATRVSDSPLGEDSEDALAERHPRADTGPPSGTASRRGRSTLGDFQLIRKLGAGAMATVYKARQLSFDRKVALKLLHKHVADNPKLVERFYREARVLGQLDHPNIVQGYGVGEAEGFHYFAMEYISGANLQSWLNKLERIPVDDALHIVVACARGLGHAHEHGLVHRDVKPDNVLITKLGEVKLADLGMVKAMDEDLALTQTGHAVGTPWYMPLEQAKNAKDVDGRSDIYALGCMLYYLVTGRPPFRGNSIVEVIQAKEIGTFPPARQYNADVPERLDLILAKMTAKQPKHRYQNCGEMIRDLEDLGLASAKLTFLRPPVRGDETPPPDAMPRAPFSEPGRSSSPPANDWFVQLKSSGGEITVRKTTTEHLFRLLEDGTVSPNAKASRHEHTGYRSLATYKEFESVALALATRSSVDKQTVKYRELYKQLEEKLGETDSQREEKKQEQKELEQSIQHGFRTALFIAGSVVGGVLLLWLLFAIIGWFRG